VELTYPLGGKLFGTLKEMLENAKENRCNIIQRNKERNERNDKEGASEWNDTYSDKRWGYFTSMAIGSCTHNTTFGQYIGLFKTGCKKALTVEELKTFGVGVCIASSSFSDDKLKKLGWERFTAVPQTSDELMKIIKEVTEIYKDIPFNIDFVGLNIDKLREIRRKKFPCIKKEKITQQHHYAISINGRHGYYVKRRSSRRLFSSYLSYRKFPTQKKAAPTVPNRWSACG